MSKKEYVKNKNNAQNDSNSAKNKKIFVGQHAEASTRAVYAHLSNYLAKKGWDNNVWWDRK